MLPWFFKVDNEVISYPVPVALYSNDESFELQVVLAGQCLGQLSGATVAPYLRSGVLLPVLTPYMADIASYFVYYGSRYSQPMRVRSFVDFAIKRLVGNTDYVLSIEELLGGEQRARQIIQARH